MIEKISVIIPVYNTKKYVKACVDSILEQKEFVHEIILINDGSTDGSGEYLEEIYSKNPLIKIHHTKNQRQGPARNFGTQISTGEFIYYFDSDDILKPGLFKRFNEILTEHQDLEIFAFSAIPLIDEDYNLSEVEKKRINSTTVYSRKTNAVCNTGEDAFNLLYKIKSFSPLPYLYIFKKSIVVENNIQYRSIRFEDEEFAFQLFLHAKKTIIKDEFYCDRRIREGSTMELDRCFADIFGYIQTNETLEKLKNLSWLKEETWQNIDKKIINLAKAMIIMKTASNLRLSADEKSTYKNALNPLKKKNSELAKFYYTYPAEYKLRMLKKKFLG
ncbi:MAG: glycosyltransferase family 2 protein [Ignavibacteriae bacterium]|nr:glycosyltransferase family 2 protein [Ignavibacteriota bacterium]